MKHEEVIERILRYHPALENYSGCDEYKAGDPSDECTGIVSALVPTVDVIRKTAELGCNLLITHEPIYYQSPDFSCWRGAFDNAVQREKEEMIKRCGITIWRDHDHMHAHIPDSIFSGVIRQMGWEAYYRPEKYEGTPLFMPFELPGMTLRKLCLELKEKISMNGVRFVGDPNAKIERAAIAAHLLPGAFMEERIDEQGFYHDYGMYVMEMMEKHDIQAIIPGEIIEWTVLSYIRDAVSQGRTRACINIGHFNWEELGMKQAVEWLGEITEHQVPVHYVPTGDLYGFL